MKQCKVSFLIFISSHGVYSYHIWNLLCWTLKRLVMSPWIKQDLVPLHRILTQQISKLFAYLFFRMHSSCTIAVHFHIAYSAQFMPVSLPMLLVIQILQTAELLTCLTLISPPYTENYTHIPYLCPSWLFLRVSPILV